MKPNSHERLRYILKIKWMLFISIALYNLCLFEGNLIFSQLSDKENNGSCENRSSLPSTNNVTTAGSNFLGNEKVLISGLDIYA